MNAKLLLALLTSCTLMAACGGGGGSADTTGGTGTTDTSTTDTTTAATPMNDLVVPSSMTWQTGTESALRFSAQDDTGATIKDVSISLFQYSTVSPQDGSPLDEPVAMELIDTVITDATGQALITSRIPAHLNSVLVVATSEEGVLKQIINLADGNQNVTLTMKR